MSIELSIDSLVAKLCEAFLDGIELLDHHDDAKEVRELREAMVEQRNQLAQTNERYFKLAGDHFRLDRQTQTNLYRQLRILTEDVVDVLRTPITKTISEPCYMPENIAEEPLESAAAESTVNYSQLNKKVSQIGSKSQAYLKAFFNRISGWAVPLNTLPPPAQTSDLPPLGSSPKTQVLSHKEKYTWNRPDFEYDKLPTAYSYRLLKINSSVLRITCEVKTVDIHDHLPYQAVSYCWGTSVKSSTIHCNGQKARVSPNLEQGLRQLHKYSKWTRQDWFWIDQICINQQDNEERTQQVRLMRAIYQRSMNTVIWIGLDDGVAKAAKSIILQVWLFCEAIERKTKEKGISLNRGDSEEFEEFMGYGLPSPKDKKWAMLAKFLESSWFERCWVVQEVVVSQGDPLILCGDQQLLWSVFQKAIVWLSQHTAFRTDRMVLINSIKTISGRQEWDHNESANVVSGLPTLLLLTTLFRATDPKDNIFSLLGLTKETRSTNDWPKVLNPDYSRSVQDLYREVTKYCIRTEGNLSILSQCDCSYSRVKESSFPSWVPRWDLIPSTRRISAFRWTSTPDNCQNVIETFNEASKGTTLAMDEETHINVLRLRGLRLSNVDVCLPTVAIEDPASPPGLPEHLYLFLETKIPEFYNICKEKVRHTSSMPFDKTYFLVTSAGLTPDNQDASHEPLMHFHAFLARTKNTLKKDQPDLDPTESLRSMVKSSLQITMPGSVSPQMATAEGDDSRSTHDRKGESERVRPNPARYLTGLMRLLNRRLFITASGQLGLGPAHMMSGDVVVVLFGGNVPYILRPLESGQWVFVGECYIEGLMRGEAVRGPDFQEESCAWFELV